MTFLSSLFYISRKDLKHGKAESLDSAFAVVLMVVSLTPSVQLNHNKLFCPCQVFLLLRARSAGEVLLDGVDRLADESTAGERQ